MQTYGYQRVTTPGEEIVPANRVSKSNMIVKILLVLSHRKGASSAGVRSDSAAHRSKKTDTGVAHISLA